MLTLWVLSNSFYAPTRVHHVHRILKDRCREINSYLFTAYSLYCSLCCSRRRRDMAAGGWTERFVDDRDSSPHADPLEWQHSTEYFVDGDA